MYTVKLRGADRCDRCSFKPLNIVMSEMETQEQTCVFIIAH